MNKDAHSGFETQRRRQQKSKTGVSVAPQKGLMPSIFILKKSEIESVKINCVCNKGSKWSLIRFAALPVFRNEGDPYLVLRCKIGTGQLAGETLQLTIPQAILSWNWRR